MHQKGKQALRQFLVLRYWSLSFQTTFSRKCLQRYVIRRRLNLKVGTEYEAAVKVERLLQNSEIFKPLPGKQFRPPPREWSELNLYNLLLWLFKKMTSNDRPRYRQHPPRDFLHARNCQRKQPHLKFQGRKGDYVLFVYVSPFQHLYWCSRMLSSKKIWPQAPISYFFGLDVFYCTRTMVLSPLIYIWFILMTFSVLNSGSVIV